MKKPKERKPKRKRRKTKLQTQPLRVDHNLLLQRLNAPAWYSRPITFAPPCYLLLVLFLVPAFVLSWAGYQKLEDERFASDIQWEQTIGRVTELEAIPAGIRYTRRIRYVYSVNGRRYVSGRRDLLKNCPVKRRTAEFFLDSYSLNQKVPIYYARNNPAFAALDPFRRDAGSSVMWVAILAFPIWLVAFVSTVAFQYLGGRNHKKPGNLQPSR